MQQYAGEVQKITNIAMQRNSIWFQLSLIHNLICALRKRVQDLYASMWIYKAVSDFGPIKFKNVIKLSHSLFSIKNKEGKKNYHQRLFFSAKANIENNMTMLVNSTLKAVRWEFKQHTMIIWSRLVSTTTIHGNSTHFQTKTSMIRDVSNGENDQSDFDTKLPCGFKQPSVNAETTCVNHW